MIKQQNYMHCTSNPTQLTMAENTIDTNALEKIVKVLKPFLILKSL